ncbi:MAG: MFS transporter [Tissierellia bacterium]|nr:MFS transporter [Tissierellia bacterium]
MFKENRFDISKEQRQILIGAFILMALGMGIIGNCASLFIRPISLDIACSRRAISNTVAIRNLTTVFISFIVGKTLQKYDLKKVLMLASLLMSIMFFAQSFAKKLYQFYIISFLISVFYTFTTAIPVSILITNWFSKNTGTALGIASMGSGLGGVLFTSLTGIWIDAFGWRIANRILAIIMILVILPSVKFFIKTRPKTAENISKANEEIIESGLSISRTYKYHWFWIIAIANVLLSFSTYSIFFTIPAHIGDLSYSNSLAANVTAMMMAVLAISKLLLGRIYDKFGMRLTVIFPTVCGFISSAFIMSKTTTLFIIIAAFFNGIVAAFFSVSLQVLISDFFGSKDYGQKLSIASGLTNIGTVLAPTLSGWYHDLNSSYFGFYKYTTIISILVIIIYVLGFRHQSKKAPF